MAKIKKTKTFLKAQRDRLSRFRRYLPTLDLKKQQLKLEVRRVEAVLEENIQRERQWRKNLDRWVRLFAEGSEIPACLQLEKVRTGTENIAGVNVPVFEDAVFSREQVDLAATPPWLDDGLDAVEELIRLQLERETLERTRDLLNEELRITSQRVNLFERVKIPECRENIRVIKIALGDEQTSSVARAKTAKGKMIEVEAAHG